MTWIDQLDADDVIAIAIVVALLIVWLLNRARRSAPVQCPDLGPVSGAGLVKEGENLKQPRSLTNRIRFYCCGLLMLPTGGLIGGRAGVLERTYQCVECRREVWVAIDQVQAETAEEVRA
jgi:hypothetical protein